MYKRQHLGHQELFKKARQIADEKGLKVALLTFPESPKLAFVRYQPELLPVSYTHLDVYKRQTVWFFQNFLLQPRI